MSEQPVLVERCARAGIMTLNRDKALNALSSEMFTRMSEALARWQEEIEVYAVILQSASPRAFCAGGDVRRVAELGKQDLDEARAYFRQEYNFDWQLDNFTKPHVALMNGLTLGGGCGISLYGTHRVAGEEFKLGMPETLIGFIPDVGGSWFLGQMPGSVGLYLGLTGRTISRADAYDLGLVTHLVPSQKFELIKDALCDAEPVDELLDGLDEPPLREQLELKTMRSWIEAVFSASTLPEIFERAANLEDETKGWSREVLNELQARSPSSLFLTLHLWRRGRELNLRRALQQEYSVVSNLLTDQDFYEGIRAALVDKDRAPKWRPDSIHELDEQRLLGYFDKGAFELELHDSTVV